MIFVSFRIVVITRRSLALPPHRKYLEILLVSERQELKETYVFRLSLDSRHHKGALLFLRTENLSKFCSFQSESI